MLYRELQQILRKINLSAEQLAPTIGVSNMTIRRWRREKPEKTVPAGYERLLISGLEQLLIEGVLPPTSEWALQKVGRARSQTVAASLASLGVTTADLKRLGTNRERMLGFLKKIGLSNRNQKNVERNHLKIAKFKTMGLDWKSPITTLLNVVRSKKLNQVEKLVAYGALFYLLCPLDLIPDSVPLFGFADDFAFVSLAAGYYLARAKRREA